MAAATRSRATKRMMAANDAVFANVDLLDKIVTHLPFKFLALTALKIDRAFCAAAQTRLKKARPLLAPPFDVSPHQVLHTTSVDLTCQGLADDGMSTFASGCGSGALAQLNRLALDKNLIGDDGMKAFSDACAKGALANVTVLYLCQNQIAQPGIMALTDACAKGALAKLEKLDLSFNKIGNDGCAVLAGACAKGSLASLTTLSLFSNQIDDAGCAALADACANGALAQLKTLWLGANQIGDAGCSALAEAFAKGALPNWNFRATRDLGGNPASDEALAKLHNAFRNRNNA